MASPTGPGPRPLAVPIWVIAGAAVVAGLLLGLALALLAGSPEVGPRETVGLDTTLPPDQPDQSPPPTPTPSVSAPPSSAPPSVRSLGIYYVGADSTGGYRLYREFRDVTVVDRRPVAAAVDAMFRLPPLDPDYTSPWPLTSRVLNTAKSGDAVTIDLSAKSIDKSVEKDLVAAAVQQLVYTATAADPSVRRVRILVEGVELAELWGHPIGDQPLGRAPAASTLAPIWIIDPAEGATVERTFTVDGSAEVFEATVSFEVTTLDGSLVEDGSVTADNGEGGRGLWSTQLTLEPNTYIMRFFSASADTDEPVGSDTKTIEVR